MSPAVVIRATLSVACSVKKRLPSAPLVMPLGTLAAVGTANSLKVPSTVIRPILLPAVSVNHSAPSGPATMVSGRLSAVGTGNQVVVPDVVIRPIRLLSRAVNHSAPSGPFAMPYGAVPAGSANSVKPAGSGASVAIGVNGPVGEVARSSR